MIFGDDNSSSTDPDNRRNNFSVLGKGPTDDINYSFGTAETKFTFNFPKANTKFSLGLHHNGDRSYLYVNRTEILNLQI